MYVHVPISNTSSLMESSSALIILILMQVEAY